MRCPGNSHPARSSKCDIATPHTSRIAASNGPQVVDLLVGAIRLTNEEIRVSDVQADTGVTLIGLQVPTLLDAETWAPTPTQVSLTPEQRVSIYNDKQWEEFVLEWATTLTSYVKVMRNGGANDHGVDVAAFTTTAGFDAAWDCYQCKHYAGPLLPSDAYPEILKIVLGTMNGHYLWPRRYLFVAPKGYGTKLAQILNAPSKIIVALKTELTKDKSTLVRAIGSHLLVDVLRFIDNADFSGFGSIELHELVDAHQATRWHAARFDVPLPNRAEPSIPDVEAAEDQQRYISQLLGAYEERHGEAFTPHLAESHSAVGSHFLRHRVAFYTAESLRIFARESVPENTFESLQGEIFDGVIDIHDEHQGDGLSKLLSVTRVANQLAITANGLLPRVSVRDRTGICHQLVNDQKLGWCDEATE